MYVHKQRPSWGALNKYIEDDAGWSSCGDSSGPHEASPLNPKVRRHTDGTALEYEDTDGWFKVLCKRYGWQYIVSVVVYVHLIDGFVNQTITMASPYIFRAYHVTAPVAQMYQSVSETPFAMKAVIALVSDIFPIRGFNKAPYIIIVSVFGCASLGCTGFFPDGTLPLPLIVAFLFLANLQIATADTLSQGAFASKVRRSLSPSRGMELLTFVFLGGDFFSLWAVVFAGIILMFTGATTLYVVSTAIALLSVYPAMAGWLEEKWVSPEQTRNIRAWFWQEKDACIYNIFTFLMTLVFTIVIVLGSPLTAGIMSLVVLLSTIGLSSLVYTPKIAKVNAFQLLMLSSTINIKSAEFYFYTDLHAHYPEGPHFSNFFFNAVVGGCSFVGMLVGTYSYKLLSERFTYRGWMLIANFSFSAVNVLTVLMYKHTLFGVPPWLWACVASFGTMVVDRWKVMPVLVMFTNLCPKNMETTVFGSLVGTLNLANAIAACWGACALKAVGCKPAGLRSEGVMFKHFWLAACWNSIVPLFFAVAFIWLVPPCTQRGNMLGKEGTPTRGSLLNRIRAYFGRARQERGGDEEEAAGAAAAAAVAAGTRSGD